MSSRWHWLESTRELQEKSFGHSFPKYDEDLANYIMMNSTALLSELGEVLAEVGWKTWATPRGWLNREEYVGELVDVAHFLANLAVAVDVTDDEWETRYRAKQEINRQRRGNGYTGREKCPGCRRAYDETTCRPGTVDVPLAWCAREESWF